jgi:hypothetical protein
MCRYGESFGAVSGGSSSRGGGLDGHNRWFALARPPEAVSLARLRPQRFRSADISSGGQTFVALLEADADQDRVQGNRRSSPTTSTTTATSPSTPYR